MNPISLEGVLPTVVLVRAIAIFFAVLTAYAQTIADPARLPENWKTFERRSAALNSSAA